MSLKLRDSLSQDGLENLEGFKQKLGKAIKEKPINVVKYKVTESESLSDADFRDGSEPCLLL